MVEECFHQNVQQDNNELLVQNEQEYGEVSHEWRPNSTRVAVWLKEVKVLTAPTSNEKALSHPQIECGKFCRKVLYSIDTTEAPILKPRFLITWLKSNKNKKIPVDWV